jgi:cell division protein FtsA
LASAEAVINRNQRENGVLVMDYGASTTNIAIFEEGDVQHVAVIPVGSHNITNDLAIGLRTEIDIAEQVKLNFAENRDRGRNKTLTVEVGGERYNFDRKTVEHIVSSRLDETLDLVDKELQKINRSGKLPGGVVLVGGGSNLRGIDEYVKQYLRLPARVAKPHGFAGLVDTIDDPQFATAIGLMLYDMHASSDGNNGSMSLSGAGRGLKSAFRMLGRWLKRLAP